jgi:hypothetical protein
VHRPYSAFPTHTHQAVPQPHRDIDTLRGIQVPGPRSQSAAQTVLSGNNADSKSSAGTALVMAMLGATLSATVGFVAIGNSHPAQPKAAAVVIAKPVAAPTVVTATVAAAVAPKPVEPAPAPVPVVTTVPVGIVGVEAPKGAKVYVDGTFFGPAPITVTAPMGTHSVKIETKKNESKTYDVVFADQPGQLKVEPDAKHRHTGGWVRPGAGSTSHGATTDAPAKDKDSDKDSMKTEIAKSKQINKDADEALGASLGH